MTRKVAEDGEWNSAPMQPFRSQLVTPRQLADPRSMGPSCEKHHPPDRLVFREHEHRKAVTPGTRDPRRNYSKRAPPSSTREVSFAITDAYLKRIESGLQGRCTIMPFQRFSFASAISRGRPHTRRKNAACHTRGTATVGS